MQPQQHQVDPATATLRRCDAPFYFCRALSLRSRSLSLTHTHTLPAQGLAPGDVGMGGYLENYPNDYEGLAPGDFGMGVSMPLPNLPPSDPRIGRSVSLKS